MINVEDWAEIRRLHRAEGLSIKEIARRLGVARNTVRDALAFRCAAECIERRVAAVGGRRVRAADP